MVVLLPYCMDRRSASATGRSRNELPSTFSEDKINWIAIPWIAIPWTAIPWIAIHSRVSCRVAAAIVVGVLPRPMVVLPDCGAPAASSLKITP